MFLYSTLNRLIHFTLNPWHTCSLRHRLNFAMLELWYEGNFHRCLLSKHSFVELSELRCSGETENAHDSKRQQRDSSIDSPTFALAVLASASHIIRTKLTGGFTFYVYAIFDKHHRVTHYWPGEIWILRIRLHIYTMCGIFYLSFYTHQIEGTNIF